MCNRPAIRVRWTTSGTSCCAAMPLEPRCCWATWHASRSVWKCGAAWLSVAAGVILTRDSVEKLRQTPIVTDKGAHILLGDVADLKIVDGPPMIRSENARLAGYVYVDIQKGADLSSAVEAMQRAVAEQVKLPAGYSLAWSGQFENLQRARARLQIVVPMTLALIFVLLFLTFHSVAEALLLMTTVPFALVGGFWLIWALGHSISVATVVGFIALAGVAAEFGVVMLIYLKHALHARLQTGQPLTKAMLLDAIREGAVLRVRPKSMTVMVIWAASSPSCWGKAPARKSCNASPPP